MATMGQSDPARLTARMGLANADVDVLIINQCPDRSVPKPYERGTVRMLSFPERGLARSRNRALEHARGDIVLLADDDVRYLPQVGPSVAAAFAAMPAVAALCFRYCDAATGLPTKRYPARPGLHDARTIAGVSSIEVALRRHRLAGVRFDERFGLGSRFPSGEEAIFLRDLQRRGAAVGHYPMTLCEHAGAGSGHAPWDPVATRAKGAILRRMYPGAWPAVMCAFALAKYPRHGGAQGFFAFARSLGEGGRMV